MQSALVLAGGEAQRFGGAKAFVHYRGRPMVSRVAEVLASRAEELIISVGTSDDERRMRALLPAAVIVTDLRRGRGPIEAFYRGFQAAHGEIVLVAPCDAPLLRGEVYELLLASLGDHEAAVPRLQVIDPLRAVYCRAAVARELGGPTEAPPSPSALVDRLDAVMVGEEALRQADPTLSSFVDVNRPTDLPQC